MAGSTTSIWPEGISAEHDGQYLYSAAQNRELDRLAISTGIPGFQLMGRAARAALQVLQQRWPQTRQLIICCGGGNNGGDGLVMAGLAAERGIDVRLCLLANSSSLQGEAAEALVFAKARNVVIESWSPEFAELICADTVGLETVLVDALLGTGNNRELSGEYAAAVAALNASAAPVMALDIPSGLCADTGRVLGVAVEATLTLSFIARKRGAFTHMGASVCGQRLHSGLAVPPALFQQCPSDVRVGALAGLAPRQRHAHKGHFGHVLCIGGDAGMAGAVVMAAQAAARSGAGLVTCASRAVHIPAMLATQPEVMAVAVDEPAALAPLLARASVVVIGPGLGLSTWAEDLYARVAVANLPTVVDADALAIMAAAESRPSDLVITPHPGEAAKLLACSNADIQADRFSAARQLSKGYKAVTVLKGSGTVIDDGELQAVCEAGNPGMASGGMGDVLSGVIAALIAQGLSAAEAARLGVELHARAADAQARLHGERGLLATDLLPSIRELLHS